ncbi:MAG: bifunctional Delta(1)-pyrroline-2-carboxylate/Delta(1)-piperideine-2-carboxylate reductase [Trinickia sp.]|uniref:bifunctional Delta(1)-pyrroline-2-carboxylate/Delta(1)-piperideine-2- carboxylate reductase n=1 Tax=Trinickia sp. TaxID=2571163 RepID=UPI003F7D2841
MSTLPTFDAAATARLLDFASLIEALSHAAHELEAGAIRSPVRTAVPLADNGVLLSMPAAASDVAIHKLVSVCPGNAARNMPTIFGTVTVCDGVTGAPEFILDGPTVTGRRTAALSMLGVKYLYPRAPRGFLIIGTGQQARHHAAAIARLYPSATIFVAGKALASEQRFCDETSHEGIRALPANGTIADDIDVVVTATTSKTPVYNEPARADRLVVAVGAFTPDAAEIGPDTVRASRVFVDDFAAAREEAGDLLQAGIDWSSVQPIGAAISERAPANIPMLLKTVGSGAWDLAACRVARAAIAGRSN